MKLKLSAAPTTDNYIIKLTLIDNGANIPSFWFQNWQVGGSKVAVNEAQMLGQLSFPNLP
ncbi:MAG: hypothetical protein KTR26_15440 [Flammeovirgaceae bacterium]|nr:hypothetical protein [Flammeovirgaceae bacterium]